jgi:Holliday junction resolvase RusA-like endonuclease
MSVAGPSYIDPPFAVPIEFTLDLPVPPSVNKLRRMDLSGHRLRKSFYRQADMHLMAARGRLVKPIRECKIPGAFEAIIILSDKLTSIDLDNCVKCLLDYAVSREFIRDDGPKYLRRLVVEWGPALNGCRLTLRSLHV